MSVRVGVAAHFVLRGSIDDANTNICLCMSYVCAQRSAEEASCGGSELRRKRAAEPVAEPAAELVDSEDICPLELLTPEFDY